MIDLPSFLKGHVHHRTVFLSSLQQRFTLGEPEYEMINENQYWTLSIPHESSGPCYTYDPPFDSDPGYIGGMYLILNKTDWDPSLEIFFHKKGKLFYQDHLTYDTIKVENSKLKEVTTGHPRIVGKSDQLGLYS